MVVKVGLAGFGRRGRRHIEAIDSESDAQLSAVSDPFEGARVEAEDTYGDSMHVFESAEAMVDSGEVDAVVVAAPAHLNGEVALDVIRRGAPVLIEKPPGLSYAEVVGLKDAAAESGARVMVAFNRRFNPLIRAAIDEVEAEGGIYQVVAEFHKDIHEFTDDPRLSSSIMDLMLLESPIHSVDLVTHIAGAKFDTVHSIVKRRTSGYRDVHAALIEFENGMVCQFSAAYTAGGRLERYELHGEYVSAYLEGVQHGWILEPVNSRREIQIAGDAQNDTAAQMSHFVNCLQDGSAFGPIGADLDSSLEVLRLCEAILSGTK